ncbi:MAG: BlaI/MecI/CopY family transcriptional regulator [Oscillospiraceae bacterium]|nr:BlaI/MecI/CopY family transcriptional regulator [Oscillospiraceae bacterium]
MSKHTISDAELEIMRIIWSEGGRVFLSLLMEKLSGLGKKWKANTVLTFLARLVEKDVLKVEKLGRFNEYVAVCSESDYTATLTQSFLGKFFEGNAKNLVASLLKQDCLSEQDFSELQEFWKDKGGNL